MILSNWVNITQLYFIICSIATIVPIYYLSIKYSVDPKFSILLYFLNPIFYLDSFSIVRNALAYSLVFLSLDFLISKKYILYLVIIIIAGGIHNTAYIGLLLPFLLKMSTSRKLNVAIFILSFFISFSFIRLFLEYLYSYFPVVKYMIEYIGAHSRQQGPLLKFIIILLNAVNLLYWNKLSAVKIENKYFLTINNIGSCLWLLFSFEATLSMRLASFFILTNIILIPSYMLMFRTNYKLLTKQLIIAFFTIFFISSFTINIIGYIERKSNRMSYLPYQTIFYHKKYVNFY